MRYVTAAAVLLSTGFMIRAWALRGETVERGQPGEGVLPVISIRTPHTPESLARLTGDPSVFRYDASARTAVCRRSLKIEKGGSLTLGSPENAAPGAGPTLEMDTDKCGSLSIEVVAGGALMLYGSTLTTVGKVQSGGPCPMGYGLNVAGRLVVIGSNIDFMSGTMSDSLVAGSEAEIRNSSIVRGDGACLRVVDPTSGNYVLEGSVLGAANPWALDVLGASDVPHVLEVRNCRFNAQFGPVNNLSRAATVDLIDCNLGRNPRFGFVQTSLSARTRVRWTVAVQAVLRRADGSTAPAAGLTISVMPLDAASSDDRDAVAVLDASGRGRVTATQWTATLQKNDPPPAGDGPTHRVTVLRDGRVAAAKDVSVRGKGQDVRLELSQN